MPKQKNDGFTILIDGDDGMTTIITEISVKAKNKLKHLAEKNNISMDEAAEKLINGEKL